MSAAKRWWRLECAIEAASVRCIRNRRQTPKLHSKRRYPEAFARHSERGYRDRMFPTRQSVAEPSYLDYASTVALTVQQATAPSLWATVGRGGLKAVIPSKTVREVIICADADTPGKMAAQATAQRHLCEGRAVRVATPPMIGTDFAETRACRDRRAA